MEQAVCPSDQRTRLTVCSPNKPELKFGRLHIPKQQSQVKGKTAGAAILSFLPCTLLISTVQPLTSQRRKGKKQRNRKSLPDASLLTQQGLPGRTQNSQDKCSTKFIKKHGSFLPGSQQVCTPLRFVQIILNLILYSVSRQTAGKVQGALADCSGRSCSIQRADAKHCILSECQLGSVLRTHLQTSSCASC